MKRKKVLIMEHNERHIRGLASRLSGQGYVVEVARNGEEGLWKVVTEQPQAIILNAHLPCASGWEVCEEVKFDQDSRHIPVVILAERPNKRAHIKAFLARCDAYLPGPIDQTRCIEAVEVVSRLVL